MPIQKPRYGFALRLDRSYYSSLSPTINCKFSEINEILVFIFSNLENKDREQQRI
jgi:hypothetical protein